MRDNRQPLPEKTVVNTFKRNIGRTMLVQYKFETGYGMANYTEINSLYGKLIDFDIENVIVTIESSDGKISINSLNKAPIVSISIESLDNTKSKTSMRVNSNSKNVFISHGKNELVLAKLERFIRNRLNLTPVILKHMPDNGLTVVEKLEKFAPTCSFGLVLLTSDDSAEGNLRARQNVIHEIGYLQALFGGNRVNLIRQDDTELFTNISGIVYKSFRGDDVEQVFDGLRLEFESISLI